MEKTIKDLKLDNRNANKHTEAGNKLLKKSINELGYGRSILLDKDERIIAGNGVVTQSDKTSFLRVYLYQKLKTSSYN